MIYGSLQTWKVSDDIINIYFGKTTIKRCIFETATLVIHDTRYLVSVQCNLDLLPRVLKLSSCSGRNFVTTR